MFSLQQKSKSIYVVVRTPWDSSELLNTADLTMTNSRKEKERWNFWTVILQKFDNDLEE